ncbi:MAG: lipoyl synthase [candidate division Zixibacteria bacterium RBG_16_43_9]|nr:MAG: lipoyl synthase [candidate division Zixibacteria bacterium RBG_16_43_9]
MKIKRERLPLWLKVKPPLGENYRKVKSLLSSLDLHTVCQEANCPNIGTCFEEKTETFLILGRICTRGCSFCDVDRGVPLSLDVSEPLHIAEAVKILGLEYVVITSVTRDDLEDGGASHFAEVIKKIRESNLECKVEVLVPDFKGDFESLKIVLREKPFVLNHNLETVKRLYPIVRKGADYQRSLNLLGASKDYDSSILTKSGIIIGMGEKWEEIIELMQDLKDIKCDLLTIGQYLSPSDKHLQVKKYYPPEDFYELKRIGEKMGFTKVESGPLVRSSYHAREQVKG